MDEVVATVLHGERIPAKHGRTGFRRNFAFGRVWRGRVYATKPVEAYAIEKTGRNMTVTYDPRYNIGYIRFRESTEEVETIKVSESLNVDLSPDGKVYGVELLDANRQLAGDGCLTFVNEASGNRNVVPTG